MNVALWIVQVIVGLMFLMAGGTKVMQPKAKLAANMGWVEDFSQPTVRVIGVLEILGAIGLIVPAVTGILPWLTPLAAAGLAMTMVGAALTHARRGEYPMIGVNLLLLALTLFVAYGRWVLAPL